MEVKAKWGTLFQKLYWQTTAAFVFAILFHLVILKIKGICVEKCLSHTVNNQISHGTQKGMGQKVNLGFFLTFIFQK